MCDFIVVDYFEDEFIVKNLSTGKISYEKASAIISEDDGCKYFPEFERHFSNLVCGQSDSTLYFSKAAREKVTEILYFNRQQWDD